MVNFKKDSGQVFSSDFLVGILVFLFAITAIQVHYSGIVEKINRQHDLLFRQTLISRTDTLVMFEGVPADWNESTVEVLGLSTGEPNYIDEEKARNFISMDPDKAERLLGLREKNFYFVLKNSTGHVLSAGGVEYERGSRDWGDAEDVYTVNRKVFLGQQGRMAKMRLVVW